MLDFGLAKPTEVTYQGDLTESPTLTYAPTGAGVILGTAAYMSPEQVRGQEVDKRSDIWAFGVVLWEMLTGRKLFQGGTLSDVLASTLMREPDWKGLPPDLPPSVQRVLKRCLVQDPKDRLHDIADARIELEAAGDKSQVPGRVPAAAKSIWARAIPWLLVPLGLIAGWVLRPEREIGPPPVVRFETAPPEGERVVHGFRHGTAISPDGRNLAYVSGKFTEEWSLDVESQIFIRSLGQWQAGPVAGTEQGYQPIFSPDGQWLAFILGDPDRLLKVSKDGTRLQTLCECDARFGASWGPDDTIIFAGESGPLRRISASGGEATPVTEVRTAEGESGHRLPHILPDGSAVVFTAIFNYRDWQQSQIVAHSFATGERELLIQGGSDGQYVSSGHLVFAREGKLFAVPFDPLELEVQGEEIPVLDGINHSIYSIANTYRTGVANIAISSSGTAAYLKGSVFPEIPRGFVVVDRQGNPMEVSGLERKQYLAGRVSPDGRRLLLSTYYKPDSVWTFDLDRSMLTRETFEGRQNWAIWGPGPDEITFASYHEGEWSLIVKRLGSGPGQGRVLYSSDRQVMVGSWSPDGEHLLVVTAKTPHAASTFDLSVLDSSGELSPFVDSDFWEGYPDFSPGGRWLAYTSTESGRLEVYVRPFPGPGPSVQISTGGGACSVWSRDGRELYYRSDEGNLVAVEVDGSGERFQAGRSQILFPDVYGSSAPVRSYDVTPDGRFLFLLRLDTDEIPAAVGEFFPDRIQVVQNWAEELKRKLRTDR